MENYFTASWIDTPDAHTSTYAAQINERVREAEQRSLMMSLAEAVPPA